MFVRRDATNDDTLGVALVCVHSLGPSSFVELSLLEAREGRIARSHASIPFTHAPS